MPPSTIQPAEYYDQAHGGGIPVFKPTMDQFSDFKAFVEAIDSYGKKSGIVKVIPPKEWKENLPDIRHALEHVRVRNPIIQHIIGSQGVYTQTNVEKRRPYTLSQWNDLCQQAEYQQPRVGPRRVMATPVAPSRKRHKVTSSVENDGQWPASNTRSKQKPHTQSHTTSKHPAPHVAADGVETKKAHKSKKEVDAEDVALARSDAAVPLNFDLHELEKKEYDVEYCKELERIYWRNITYSQPMYGADMLGTLFDKSVGTWNVNNLDNILNRLGVALPGVNEPYLYFGMWKATFAWHVEDMDLYSINYNHFGAPKQWYSIPTQYSKKFESVMQTIYFQQHKACPQFLRHKTFLVSPKVLEDQGVPVYRCVQQQGEFIITFPFGYHAGYNLGFNCAESVNFALDSWLEIGKRAKACGCISDSVMIDVSLFERTAGTDNSSPDCDRNGHLEQQGQQQGQQWRQQKRKHHEPESNPKRKCVLCPNDRCAEEKTNQGDWVHTLCAEAIPETSLVNEGDGRVVHGVSTIPKARKKLTCIFCRQQLGACAQCCKGRCWRAFHATCAKDAGATMEQRMDKDGGRTYDIYCPQHDPAIHLQRQQEKQKYKQQMIQEMAVGRRVKARFREGYIFNGTIEACDAERKACSVSFDEGFTRKIQWKDIEFL